MLSEYKPIKINTIMRRTIFLVALLMALVPSSLCQGQSLRLAKHTKSDGYTQVALMKQFQAKVEGRISLLAKVSQQFDAARMQSQGIAVGTRAGNIVTLHFPLRLLPIVDAESSILQYSLARPLFPTMNDTRFDTHTDSVQAGEGLPRAYTGNGVLIGITDWGFDYTHPNYNNKWDDNHRLLRAWDQFRHTEPHPAGYDYGTVFSTRDELLEAKCDTSNIYGYNTHGTHVAGICAGHGYNGKYVGQAPGADLMFATFLLNEASWMDAAGWLCNEAKAMGRRLVINNSWGMYTLGPIDGTSLVSQAINSLSDSGIVFVVSAGNCGDDQFHLMHTFQSGTSDTLRTTANYYTYATITGQSLVLWGEVGKSFGSQVVLTSGADTATCGWWHTAGGDQYIDTLLVLGSDTIPVDVTIEESNIFNQRPHVHYNVGTGAGIVHLMVTADEGTVHGWNICNLPNGAGNMGTPFTSRNLPGYVGGDDFYGIGEPACAENTIAVAAHTADRMTQSQFIPGDLTYFSSRGPIMDGRHKPDVSAPGYQVVSSISTFCEESYTAKMTINYDGRKYIWSQMSGTSMSGPAVTGIVALMLEANPYLSVQQVRDILGRTARNDSRTGVLHDNDSISDEWGWGKADALHAVNEALAHLDIQKADNSWFAKSMQVYPNPTTDRLTVLTGRDNPERVVVYSIQGSPVVEQEVTLEGVIDLTALPRGVYYVRCGSRSAKVVKN